MRAIVIGCILLCAAGCSDAAKVQKLEKDLEVSQRNYFETKDRGAELRQELIALEKALEGSKAALTSETERANRLATQLGTTEMELSDAELLITELQNEIKRTRAALAQAQSEGEQRAFERLKKELEKRRAAAVDDLASRQAERKRNEAAWAVALQKVLPPAKQLLNSDEEFRRYVAGFGFASDRPLFNIRVRPAFTTDDRIAATAAAARLRAALAPLVAAGVKLAQEQGHNVGFGATPSLRFYDATAPDPDDAIGKIVAEWPGESAELKWRK